MKSPTTTTTLATLAAVASQSSAAVVQISLDNNFLTATVNQLTADFTGNGNDEFVISGVYQIANPPTPGFYMTTGTDSSTFISGTRGYYSAGLSINGTQAFAGATVTSYGASAYSGSSIAGTVGNGSGITILLPISFTDMNYGGAINGWLEVNTSNYNPRIDLRRIIWDSENLLDRPMGVSASDPAFTTATPIPEVSTLALLALGAGGLALRRRRAA